MNLWNDLRYAFRQLRKSPGFMLTAILTLALGIGVNAAVFTVFNKVLLHTMPVKDPGNLVLLEEHSNFETGWISTEGGDQHLYFSYPAYRYMRDNNHVLEGLAADVPGSANLVGTREADRVNIHMVTGNYFHVMGVRPTLGRLFEPADDQLHAGNPVAVLEEDYWKSKFAADPSILNQTVKLNGTLFTIVGVVRHQGLLDDMKPALFIPVSMQSSVRDGDREDRLNNPLFTWAVVVGRLNQGISRSQAAAQMNTLWWNWRRDVLKERSSSISRKKEWLETHLSLVNGQHGVPVLQQMLGAPLQSLSIMSLLVLVIACVNVANLLLVKAARKHIELAVRGALGASRGRLFQQVVAEGLLLGAIGAVAGLLLGLGSLKLVVAAIPETNYLHDILQAPVDTRVTIFCVVAGLLTSLIFSIAPALLSTRINLIRALHGQSGSVAGGGSLLRNILVTGECALSLVLLMGATLVSWNLYELRHINPGFTASHAMTFRIDASHPRRPDLEVYQEYETLKERIERLPGVYSVSYASNGLMTGNQSGSNVTVTGFTEKNSNLVPDNDAVTAGFFSTMQIPLLAGREFNLQDTPTAPRVAIVDEKFVKHYFGGNLQKALRSQFAFGSGDVKPDIQIVGVIPTISAMHLDDPTAQPIIYQPYPQILDKTGKSSSGHHASYYIRTVGDTSALAGTLHDTLHRFDPDIPMPEFETMQGHVDSQMFETKLMAILAVSMGALALLLSAIGLYGVLSFVVGQRTREIGIRIALGAAKANISALIVRQVMILLTVGLPVGLFLGWGAIRMLRTKNDQLHAAPLFVYGVAGAVLLAAMFLASWLPAHRAASVDPMEALRSE